MKHFASPILITGCSSGIGKATALRLARAGFVVYATARKTADLVELEGAGCRALALDVTSEQSMAAAVATVEKECGAVGVLINNAGYSQSGAIEAVPIERVRAQFETNVVGLVRLSQLVLPGMRRQGFGRIINMSSMGGKLVFPGFGFYHATKYAVEALSDALRLEVKAFGVDVVLIEPGLIRSGFSEAAVGGISSSGVQTYDAFHAAIARSTKESYETGPMASLAGEPDDVARAVEKAIRARAPRTRYTVTASARFFLALRRLLSDRLWDWFLARSFPLPGRSS